MLTFHFTGPKGEMTVPEILTAGMIGKQVKFTFSSDWDGFQKSVTFLASDGPNPTLCQVELTEDTAAIPAQVLARPWHTLYVTVHGYSPDGKQLIPSLRTRGPRILPGENMEELPQTDPENPIWHQVLGQMGNLSALVTKHQDTLVGAINEVAESLDTVEHGYYLPDVTQADRDTAIVSFTPSHGFLQPVPSATISLPAGAKGDSVYDVKLKFLSEDTANREDIYQLDVYISSGTAAHTVNAGTIRVKQGANGASVCDAKLKALPGGEDDLADTYQLDVYISSGTAVQAVNAGTIQVPHGKSAYTLAQEAGYPGTEAELAQKLASQPDWSCNDPAAPGYIQNRPFYSSRSQTVLYAGTMTFDEDYCSVVDQLMEAGKTYQLTINGITYTDTAAAVEIEGIQTVALGNYPLYTGGVSNGKEYMACTAEVDGLMQIIVLSEYVPEGDMHVQLKDVTETVIPLPEQFMPPALQQLMALGIPSFTEADNGKVLGVAEGCLAWVLPVAPETVLYDGTVTISYDTTLKLNAHLEDGQQPLVLGNSYKVYFAGSSYILTAVEIEGSTGVYLGNTHIWDNLDPDTGLPFMLQYIPLNNRWAVCTDGSITGSQTLKVVLL